MSAYIVDDETINKIVAGLKFAGNNQDNYNSPFPPLSRELILDGARWPESFGPMLRELNEIAVRGRYPGHETLPGPIDEQGKTPPYTYTPIIPPTAIQLYKSLRCFLYQCSEDALDGNEIIQHLDDYAKDICCHLVNRSQAYENAKWG